MVNGKPTGGRQRAPIDRVLFGEVLATRLGVAAEHVQTALREQQQSGGRLGEVLFRRGIIDRDTILRALAIQARTVARAQSDAVGESFPVPLSLSLCLPAFNEAENIAEVVESACAILPEFVREYEVVVVDDGSTDATAAIVKELAGDHPEVRLLSHPSNRGYGAAVGTGLKHARGELVAFLDADGQFSLLDLPAFLTQIAEYDAVIGYRYRRADPLRRLLMGWAWNRLLRWLVGVKVRDIDCAFKVFRRDLLDRLRLTATSPGINAEILVQCARLGARVAQVPVRHFPRYHGVPAGAGWRMILRCIRELPHLVRCRFAALPATDERASEPAPALVSSQSLAPSQAVPERGAP